MVQTPVIKIAPSLLSADVAYLADEIRKVEDAGADWLHVDVMDGHFVPNLTLGPFVVEAIKRVATRPLDVHLMIEHPAAYAEAFAKAGADIVSFHIEVEDDPHEVARLLRRLGCRPSVVLSPDTTAAAISDVAEHVDMALVMTVYPGFPGQKFIQDMLPKIEEIRSMMGPDKDLEVDGGITEENVGLIYDAGANVIVAGTSIFRAHDMAAAIAHLRNAGRK